MMSIHTKKIYDKIPGETLKRIKEKIYTVRAELNVVIYQTEEPVPFEEKTSGKKIPLAIGENWASCLIARGFILQGLFLTFAKGKRLYCCWTLAGKAVSMTNTATPKGALRPLP